MRVTWPAADVGGGGGGVVVTTTGGAVVVVVGKPPAEDAWLGKATERIFLPAVRMTLPEIEAMQTEAHWDEAGTRLAAAAAALEAGGADLLLLCTNTMHKVADRIERAVSP